jgi:DNA-binding response OmpR family regulator
MSVLIIEDNVAISTMLSKFLKKKGMTCTVSNSGRDGLELILKNEWNNVLLDLSMPGFSGFDVLEALKKDNVLKSKNVILFTAMDVSAEEIVTWKNEGIKSIIRKPVDFNALLEVLVA